MSIGLSSSNQEMWIVFALSYVHYCQEYQSLETGLYTLLGAEFLTLMFTSCEFYKVVADGIVVWKWCFFPLENIVKVALWSGYACCRFPMIFSVMIYAEALYCTHSPSLSFPKECCSR
jgi:hypothetical protein